VNGRRIDPRYAVMWVVVILIALFGGAAVFTERSPLDPYWITLFTGVLGITAATTSRGSDADDDDERGSTSFFDRFTRRPRPRKDPVAPPESPEGASDDRGDHLRRRHDRRLRPI
jgi:hypothetical protein